MDHMLDLFLSEDFLFHVVQRFRSQQVLFVICRRWDQVWWTSREKIYVDFASHLYLLESDGGQTLITLVVGRQASATDAVEFRVTSASRYVWIHVIEFCWNRSSLRVIGSSATVNEHGKLNFESISNFDHHIVHGQPCINPLRIRKPGYSCVAFIPTQWLLSDSSQSHWKLFYAF